MGMDLIGRWQRMSKAERKAEKRDRNLRRRLVQELKNVPCQDCGMEYPPEAMDFDHIPGRGGKLGGVGTRPSLRAVLEEAGKCDVVCSNCHRVRTRKRRHDKRIAQRERASAIEDIVAAVERQREVLKGIL